MERIVPTEVPITTRLVVRRHVDFALVNSALCSCCPPQPGFAPSR